MVLETCQFSGNEMRILGTKRNPFPPDSPPMINTSLLKYFLADSFHFKSLIFKYPFRPIHCIYASLVISLILYISYKMMDTVYLNKYI